MDDATLDFTRIGGLKPPVKRAAYSDRTAWLMAILAEIAYLRLDEDADNSILALAEELANITNQDEIADRLRKLSAFLDTQSGETDTDNQVLRQALATGDFTLKGVLYDAATDTQGYVAVRRSDDGLGMAVVAFRGTQQVKDWLTNLNAEKTDIHSTDPANTLLLGRVHRGFNAAFLSVRQQMTDLLADEKDMPVYITGHSLGGALATLATWYTNGNDLAACYTFGAPRVGDDRLAERFRTPIYRLVNGIDPVPMVPPSGITIDILKTVFRFAATFFTPLNWVVRQLVRVQGYRHYGPQRYLSIAKQADDGTFPKLRLEHGVSTLERFWRQVMRILAGDFTRGVRLDKYHNMALYRMKLRDIANKRQQKL